MPHECINCGRTFEDGSKEMLAGCPECGGNKFQFRPAGIVVDDGSGSEADAGTDAQVTEPTDASATEPTDESTGGPSRRSGSANAVEIEASTDSTSDAASDRDASAGDADDSPTADGSPTAGDSPTAGERSDARTTPEDRAQANARSDVVSPDELPKRPPAERGEAGRVIEPETDERPDIDDLREELNDQFESIKIVRPGEYELNLMELYDRQEYIISLQEDGRYVIEVPDSWSRDEEDE